jgi:hypothetical protein
MKNKRGEFRKFYQEIVDKFIENQENIYNFIKSKQSNKKNDGITYKHRKVGTSKKGTIKQKTIKTRKTAGSLL